MVDRSADADATSRRTAGRWSLLLPWGLGLLAVAWVVRSASGDAVLAALRQVDPLRFAAFCLGFALLNLLLDAVAAVPTYRYAAPELKFRDYLVVRGAAHLGGAVNVHLGQAHVAVLLVRVYGARLTELLATIFVCYGTALGAIVGLAAIPLLRVDAPAWLTSGVLVLLAAALLYGVALVRPPAALARLGVFAKLREIGVRTQSRLLLLRLPMVALQMVELWVAYSFFGIELPLHEAAVAIPVLTLVSAVPLVPHGIGARDLAAFALLGAAVGPEQLGGLVSAGIALGGGKMLTHMVVGLAFVPAIGRLRATRQG